MPHSVIRSPYSYFGSKRSVTARVWELLGNPPNFVDPFSGSMIVLLSRPEEEWPAAIETVNEWNPFISNFWRAVKADPMAVAHYADHIVAEADLHARHLWLVKQGPEFRERMMTDPDWFDPKIAGWWVWGINLWIGHEWCDLDAPRVKRSLPQVGGGTRGVHRQELTRKIPQMNGSQGVHRSALTRQLPQMKGATGVHREGLTRQIPALSGRKGLESSAYTEGIEEIEPIPEQDGQHLLEYFGALSRRLRRVRVTCGNWDRVLGPSVTTTIGTTGVFLDPPYETGAHLYGAGTKPDIARDVVEWAKANWADPNLRIILCGYEGEGGVPPEWPAIKWKQRAGYQSQDKGNNIRERMWYSPACIRPDWGPMFADLVRADYDELEFIEEGEDG